MSNKRPLPPYAFDYVFDVPLYKRPSPLFDRRPSPLPHRQLLQNARNKQNERKGFNFFSFFFD